jgi:DNA-binding XRE family transcriptional regulator
VGEAAGTGGKLSKGYRAHKGCTQTTLSLTVECEQNTLILSTDKTLNPNSILAAESGSTSLPNSKTY